MSDFTDFQIIILKIKRNGLSQHGLFTNVPKIVNTITGNVITLKKLPFELKKSVLDNLGLFYCLACALISIPKENIFKFRLQNTNHEV
jgi:hypothetical protein